MKIRSLLLASLLATTAAQADLKAKTSDGRDVLLKDNGLWEFVRKDGEKETPTAPLSLELRKDIPNGCRLGLRMVNDLGTPIRSLVLRFTAYTAGDVEYETVSRGYSRIKPTKEQYQEIRFRGVGCDDIDKVQVRAAHNCHVGELTKYSASEETCLALIKTLPSELMTIYQAPRTDGK